MVKSVGVDFQEISQVLKYDPIEGSFVWLKAISSRARVGCRAGVWQKMQNGKEYYSVTYKGRKMSGGQLAWCLQTGEWPDRSVYYKDDNPLNLKFTNLKIADHKSERIFSDDGKLRYRMSQEQGRHYGLLRNYGMSMTEYAQKFAAQGGVCEICERSESAMIPGRVPKESRTRVRDLSVDHDHKSGAIRGLLCNACNHMLGQSGDDPKFLRAGADYIERYQAMSNTVLKEPSE